jgi:hypothetical protein
MFHFMYKDTVLVQGKVESMMPEWFVKIERGGVCCLSVHGRGKVPRSVLKQLQLGDAVTFYALPSLGWRERRPLIWCINHMNSGQPKEVHIKWSPFEATICKDQMVYRATNGRKEIYRGDLENDAGKHFVLVVNRYGKVGVHVTGDIELVLNALACYLSSGGAPTFSVYINRSREDVLWEYEDILRVLTPGQDWCLQIATYRVEYDLVAVK